MRGLGLGFGYHKPEPAFFDVVGADTRAEHWN